MFVRRRPLLRAAVVGGGAYMMGKSRARSQADQEQSEAEQNQRIDDLEQQQTYQQPPPYQQQTYQQPPPYQQPQPPPAAPSQSSAMLDQLNQLAALHQQGVLTDEEFAAAKAKLFAT
jgi:hypothetical protein